MKDIEEHMIAVCGIYCSSCPIFRSSFDIKAAEGLVGWFQKIKILNEGEGAARIQELGPYCMGCRGDRSKHWSANCEILQCCTDEKGLDYCYECEIFPCGHLEEWSEKDTKYILALENLHYMKQNRTK